jgi:chromodomain-helicase-DNA-binding protein 4
LSFSFAKIWEADKDALAEVIDQDQSDSWAQTLEKITAEQEKTRIHEIALSGRGARRRAAIAKVAQLCFLVFSLLIYLSDVAKRLRRWNTS